MFSVAVGYLVEPLALASVHLDAFAHLISGMRFLSLDRFEGSALELGTRAFVADRRI
jgi:hypothetical protein